MTRYDLREFNAWLEENPKRKEVINWGVSNVLKVAKETDDYTFEKIEQVPRKMPSLGWREEHLMIVKKWMKKLDQKEAKKKLKELHNQFFPNQPYDFAQLFKQEALKLKVRDLASQTEHKKTELERSVSSAKLKAFSFSKVVDLMLEAQNQISQIAENAQQDKLSGKIEVCQAILEDALAKEEIQTLLDEQNKLCRLEGQLTSLWKDLQEIDEKMLQAQIQIPPKH